MSERAPGRALPALPHDASKGEGQGPGGAASDAGEATTARGRWRADLTAGLCVAGLLLPEGVAYAGLAHLPVAHALVACLVGLFVYALLGQSRAAIVAPTSSSASLAAAAALGVGGVAPAEALLALTLAAGAALLLLGLSGQGQLSAFVSRPVLRGFSFALAITIVIKQLPELLGLQPPGGLDRFICWPGWWGSGRASAGSAWPPRSRRRSRCCCCAAGRAGRPR